MPKSPSKLVQRYRVENGKRFRLATAAPSTLGWEHDYRVIERWSCGAA